MKKIYLKPAMTVVNVHCNRMIAESLNVNSQSETVHSSAILTNDRNEYEGEDHNGWSDGLW